MVAKRKTIIYAERPRISPITKAELKPIVYLAAIGIPLVIIMWALGKERE